MIFVSLGSSGSCLEQSRNYFSVGKVEVQTIANRRFGKPSLVAFGGLFGDKGIKGALKAKQSQIRELSINKLSLGSWCKMEDLFELDKMLKSLLITYRAS